jgi:hypothetical protein
MPDFHVTFRDLLHAVNLRHETNGFTSLPKEVVLRIFSPWKIRSGLNPRTWVLKASTQPLDHRSLPPHSSHCTFISAMKFQRRCRKHFCIFICSIAPVRNCVTWNYIRRKLLYMQAEQSRSPTRGRQNATCSQGLPAQPTSINASMSSWPRKVILLCGSD